MVKNDGPSIFSTKNRLFLLAHRVGLNTKRMQVMICLEAKSRAILKQRGLNKLI